MERRLLFALAFAAFGAIFLAVPGIAARERAPAPYIVVLDDAADAEEVAKKHGKTKGVGVKDVFKHALKAYAADLTPEQLASVKQDPSVAFVSEDREVHIDAQELPTGVNRIDGDASSTVSGNGSGSVNVKVAVLDTGIDVDHPDLNVVGGTNCLRKRRSYNDGNGHGTHVAGTIGAKDDASGVVGVAPSAGLRAVKVLSDSGSGTWSSVICGVDWVTATRTDADATNDIAVANMSLGGSGSDDGNCGNSNGDALHKAICNSVAKGVTYVVAAGNSGANFAGSVPAAYDEVLTVTAVADFNGLPGGGAAPTCRSDGDDTFADFSNYATLAADQGHTIAAPGVCIRSTWKGGGYATISGTSMAAPHAAGVAALCIAGGACGTPSQIVQKLRSDAASYNAENAGYGFQGDPLRPSGSKYFGYLIRAAAY